MIREEIEAALKYAELQLALSTNDTKTRFFRTIVLVLRAELSRQENAPTIESPRHDWTPCAEGLPEKVDKRLWSRDVLATIKQKTGNCFVVVAYYHYGHEQWKTDDMTDNDAIDVLAWQPLPVPYNPDRKEDAK